MFPDMLQCIHCGFETKLIAEEVGENFEWDAVPMPKVENGKNNLMYATGYAMLNTSEHKDAAWTFLKEAAYANEDMAKETAAIGLPACKNIAETYYKDLSYGPIKNSYFLEGLDGAKLNIWGGAFAAAGDVYTQIGSPSQLMERARRKQWKNTILH